MRILIEYFYNTDYGIQVIPMKDKPGIITVRLYDRRNNSMVFERNFSREYSDADILEALKKAVEEDE